MVNRNLMRQYDLPEDVLTQELEAAFSSPETGSSLQDWLPLEADTFEVNKIINGRVANIVGDDVVIDVGYKSEGIIPRNEWYDEGDDKVHPPKIGEQIQGPPRRGRG